MSTYKRLYIQKMTTNASLKETVADFGMWVMADLKLPSTEAKSLPQNDWQDGDGLEEYIPSTGLPIKSQEVKISFGYKTEGWTGAADGAKAMKRMETFCNYLSGRDNTGPWMKIYFEGIPHHVDNNHIEHGIGRQKVRFVSASEPKYFKSGDNERLFFDVTLKIDDPITRIEKSVNNLIVST